MALHPIAGAHHRVGRYREIVRALTRHGFGYLLDQSGLGETASASFRLITRSSREGYSSLPAPRRLRLAIEELGTVAIKLGQFLSTRPDLLSEEFLRELESLQDTVPPFPYEQVRAQVQAELGYPLEELFASFEPEPIAAGSLAQVHLAQLPSGEDVVVKVQRPEIEETIEEDLSILADLAAALEQRTEWARLWGLADLAAELSRTLGEELDFTGEGHNADLIRENSEGEPEVWIPRVHWDRTSRRVLTLERVGGLKISDTAGLEAAGADLRAIAHTFARVTLKHMLLDGFFHGDPHPGNVLVDSSGRIVLMDFGMVGEVDEEMRSKLVALVMALVHRDVDRLARALLAIAASDTRTRVDEGELRRDLRRLLRRYYRMPLREVPVSEALNETASLARKHHVRMPADLMLLVKALVTIEGIATQLDPEISIVDVAEPFGRELMAQRFSLRRVRSDAVDSLVGASDFAMALPGRFNSLLEQVERGQLTLRTDAVRDEEERWERERLVNRVALALVVAGGSAGSGLLLQASVGPIVWGIPVLGIVALLLAMSLGLLLVLGILRSGRF